MYAAATKPKSSVQTFEDWASESSPSYSAAAEQQPAVITQPPVTEAKQAYLETAFEDWVEQREMGFGDPATNVEQALPDSSLYGNEYDDVGAISRETVEGDIEIRVEVDDSEETLEDGSTVHRQIVTRRRICPVSELFIVNDVATKGLTTDKVIDIEIEEDILVLPSGVASPDESDNLETTTEVSETEDKLPDGTPVRRKVVTTVVRPKSVTSQQPEDGVSDIDQRAELIVNQSVEAALEEVRTDSPSGKCQ